MDKCYAGKFQKYIRKMVLPMQRLRIKWSGQLLLLMEKNETFGIPQMQNARVATATDFWELRKEDSHVEQGYGVLYGDDATETADDIVEVYGYDYEHNTLGRGMRGCFVYNSETGKSLFFPHWCFRLRT